MKRATLISLTLALGTLGAFSAPAVRADTVVTTTPGAMTYSGVVSEINPTSQVIIMRPAQPSAAPVTYTFTPQTVFLDSTGNTVTYEMVRNVPVTVEYYSEGGRTIVRRVIATAPLSPVTGR